MIPVLQQMFVPAGAAMAAPEVGAPASIGFENGAVETGAQEADANPTGDFAALFVAQDLPKPTVFVQEQVFAESTDISAIALVDAGALIALRIPELPNSATLPQGEAAIHLADGQVAATTPFAAADQADMPKAAQKIQDNVLATAGAALPVLPLDMLSPDAARTPQINTSMTAAAQSAVLPLETGIVPDEIKHDLKDVDPKAMATAKDQIMPLAQPTVSLQRVVSQTAAQDVVQDGPSLAPPQPVLIPQTLPISSKPMVTSIAESMFHTQIDAQDMSVTESVAPQLAAMMPRKPLVASLGNLSVIPVDLAVTGAKAGTDVVPVTVADLIKTLAQKDDSIESSSTLTEDGAEVDLAPTLTPILAQDKVQQVALSLGADGQPLLPKAEATSLQSVPTFATAPNPLPTAPHLAAQILSHSQAAKTGPVEVLLNPAELGHLRFEIHQKGEHVQVFLSAERPETLDLLRRNGEQLVTEFRNAGFAGASLSFGQWGRSSDGQPPASFIANSEDDFGPMVLPPSAKPPMAQDNSRNLNLRL